MASTEKISDPRFRQPRCLFYGIGAQKAGTTWIHKYLESHPEVHVPRLKEQHYWDSVRPPNHRFLVPDTGWARFLDEIRFILLPPVAKYKGNKLSEEWTYRQRAVVRPRDDHRDHASALFLGWQDEHAVGEITPDYTILTAETFSEMAKLSENSRFFFIMRDPVARVISALRMQSVRSETRDYQADLSAEDRLQIALDGRDKSLLDYSNYARTIQALESVVPADRIAYFFYETLFDQTEIDRLTEFLGVASHPAELNKVVNKYDEPISPISDETMANLVTSLEPTYQFIRAKFGSDVPESWKH